MFHRTRLLCLLALAGAACARLGASNLDGSSRSVGDAEAARLYAEANAYVKNMAEGDYSYAYLQFYWKRAQANVDRIRRVYADSPTARELAAGALTLGPYPLDYFRERVLYNLEVKQRGAFDDVNCAIFLYGLDEKRSDAARDQALAGIIEVLARRQRWGEALRFPVLDAHKPLLYGAIFRVAAFHDQADIVKKLRDTVPAPLQAAAGFDSLQAQALVFLGKPRSELSDFLSKHPAPAVRLAAAEAVVDRANLLRRFDAHHLPPGNSIQTVHDVVLNLALRDDAGALVAQILAGNTPAARSVLSVYNAARGIVPGSDAPVRAHLAYQRALADLGRTDDAVAYARRGCPQAAGQACTLFAIELLAEAGRPADADALRLEVSRGGPGAANAAALAAFTGAMDSTEVQLVARTRTFSSVPITDPCVMAKAIMDWSLTPNRSQRGASPWDAVVLKFAGGFANLPKPASAEVGEAASTVKPY